MSKSSTGMKVGGIDVAKRTLEAAVNGGAEAIVTFNLRDFGLAPSAFGIDVLLPRDALRRLTK